MKEKKIKNLPEVGKEYHFWDDGKKSMSRHYICRIERIITPEEAKNIIVQTPDWDPYTNETKMVNISLYNHWLCEVKHCDWIYNEDTDFFVEASCPTYDEYNLWFVRSKDNGWFSMDIQHGWQSGDLDINGKIFEDVIKYIEEDDGDPSGYYETTYEKH